jgi:hypothetical protein
MLIASKRIENEKLTHVDIHDIATRQHAVSVLSGKERGRKQCQLF